MDYRVLIEALFCFCWGIHVNMKYKRNNKTNKSAAQLAVKKRVSVFDIAEMQSRKDKAQPKSNVAHNMTRYLDYLKYTNGELELLQVNHSVLEGLKKLAICFPNFKLVIEFYVRQIALQLLNPQAVFYADPVLIIGGAGIGKTAFTYALARVINTPCEIISLSTATSGFVLAGSSPNWGEGRLGKVVEKMASAKKANPLIMLDELDKVGGDNRYDPIGSLYQLLEKETAKGFIDEGLEIPTDCSHIVWLATANKEELIPDPILSRFTIFNVRTPSKHEMIKVVNSIYSNILKENVWGKFFDEQMSLCAIESIIDSQVMPRKIQQIIKDACAQIAFDHTKIKNNRRQKRMKFKVKAEHITAEKGPIKIPMGFC